MTVRYEVGDVRDVMATLADGSVSLIASSPPFIALRSYLPAQHPDKAAEIGSEPDPATFLDTLLALTAEWGRVLAPWGSIAIELGDTFAGSGGAGGDYNEGGLRDGQGKADGSSRRSRTGWHRAGSEDPDRYRSLGAVDSGSPGGGPGWPRAKFAGTGTTLAVADLHGRDAIGIDLDARNRDLYPRRRDECARALFDVRPQMTGQLSLMGET